MSESASVLEAALQGLVDEAEVPKNQGAMAEGVDLRVVRIENDGPRILLRIVERLALVEMTERRHELANGNNVSPRGPDEPPGAWAILARLGNRPVALGELESTIELGTHDVVGPEPEEHREGRPLLRHRV